MIESFSDPAFQRLLVKAEQEAAASEREADYDLLTELLVYHVQKGDNRKNRAGVLKATEIVDLIDNTALCASISSKARLLCSATIFFSSAFTVSAFFGLLTMLHE